MTIKGFLNLRPVQALLVIVYLGILGFVFIPHFIHTAQTGRVPKERIVSCPKIGRTYLINVRDDRFEPNKLTIKVCDKIFFKNTGSKYHQPAFGDHPIHLIYPNYNEKALKAGEMNDLIMKAFGNFKIHDHIYEEVGGEIIVERPAL